MDERRKSVRLECELPSKYQIEGAAGHPNDESHFTAFTRDISEGGVRFQVLQFLGVGKKIHLYLEIPHAEPIEAQIEIRWIREVPHSDQRFEAGGQFTNLAEDQHQEIRRYIVNHTPRGGFGHFFKR